MLSSCSPPSVKAMEEGYTTTNCARAARGKRNYHFSTRDSLGMTATTVTFQPSNADASSHNQIEYWNEGSKSPTGTIQYPSSGQT